MEVCIDCCDFVYDENFNLVCRKCGYVATKEDKKRWLRTGMELLRKDELIDKPQNN